MAITNYEIGVEVLCGRQLDFWIGGIAMGGN